MLLISFDGSCALWEQIENSCSVLESVSSPLKIIVVVVVCVHDCRGRMKGVRSLELELEVAVSHLMWVPGAKLSSSARAAGALHCQVISPAPDFDF